MGWISFMVLATSVPYVLNWLTRPSEGLRYSWIVPPYPEDSYAYMAWSQQAAHGDLLFRLKYTALPHTAFLFHPLFLICGWLSRIFGCDIGIVHLVVKAVGVVCFFAAFYRYTDYLGLNGFQSRLASILVGVSSGLGAFISFLDPTDRSWWASSADLWVVDLNTFWSLLWNPLFPYSLCLMLLAVHWMDRGTREGRRPDLWRSGLATGLQVLIHPYAQPLFLVMAPVLVFMRRRAEAAAYLWRYALAALPCLLYVDAVAVFNPVASRHSAQGAMVSPPFTACLMGFGLPLLLAVAGVVLGWRREGGHFTCVLWFVSSLGLSYAPFWFQRKLLFGAHVPLCILAGVAPTVILARFREVQVRPWTLRLGMVLFLPLVIATPVYIVVTGYAQVHANEAGAYFIDDALMKGLVYLKENTRPASVVFATPTTSLLVPAYSGNTVVWGHWAQSLDRQERERWLADLFRPGSDWNDAGRSRKFWASGIDYILVDAQLNRWIQQNPASWRVILADGDQVFANTSVVIYKRRA